MTLNGMPIQFLNGTDTTDNNIYQQYYDVLSGVDFNNCLDGTDDADNALFKHLTKTRNIIAARPDLVRNQNPETALQMVDYAIKYWHTPQRDKALDILEHQENMLMGLGAIYYDFEEGEALEGFWKKVNNARKKVGAKVKNAAKKVGAGVKKAAQKTWQAVKRFNPLSVTIRAGILAAFTMNMGQFATKSYPAIMPGFAPDVTAKSKQAYAQIKKIFVDQLGGKESKLQKAIKKGYKRKWTKKIPTTEAEFKAELNANAAEVKQIEKEEGVNGLGAEPVTTTAAATAAATATPFLVKIGQIITRIFGAADKVKKGAEKVKTGVQVMDAGFQAAEQMKQLINQNQNATQQQPSQPAQQAIEQTTETNINEKPKEMNDTNPTLMSRVKKYAPLAIGAIAVGTAVYFITRKKKTTTRRGVSGIDGIDGLDGLDGTRRRRTTARKTTTRKRTTTARKKLATGRTSNARRVRTR